VHAFSPGKRLFMAFSICCCQSHCVCACAQQNTAKKQSMALRMIAGVFVFIEEIQISIANYVRGWTQITLKTFA
jgi:hypothetical protein